MLSEDRSIRQIQGEPRRRWFSDDEFDLIVWFEPYITPISPQPSNKSKSKRLNSNQLGQKQDRIVGFQLCYDKSGYERAVTWKESNGYSHHNIDTGEIGYKSKRTPILTVDAEFDHLAVARKFRERDTSMEQRIAQFVYEKILQYNSSATPPARQVSGEGRMKTTINEDVKLPDRLNNSDQQPIMDTYQALDTGNPPADKTLSDIENLFEELNQLTGLERVKQEVHQLIQFVKIQGMRQQRGLRSTGLSLHTVYYGSPGTGKTTVARIYGKMLKALGLLERGHLVETDRSGLVANFVGQTAIKTDNKINEAMGGVLFIDEAYSLYKSEQAAQWDFGSEAIEVLMKRMEDNRNNLAVIVAGYPEPMDKFLNSNEGFKSRFVNYIHFEDYTPAELTQIFVSFCKENNYSLSDEALQIAQQVIASAHAKKEKTFGNARYCRNLFEQVIRYQAMRIGEVSTNPTKSQLAVIEAQDISPLLNS